MRRLVALLLGALVGLVGAGCGDDRQGRPDEEHLTVFAAASLTEAFTQIGREFEATHAGSTVTFNFAGSSALATQINQGAPADVFASAAPAPMTAVTGAGNATGPVVFARNQLVIAVPTGNPKHVTDLSDLAGPGVKVALCAAQVPCGAATRQVLAASGVAVTPVTYEQDVRGALSKVRLGEVDAALVYRTDVRAASAQVSGVEFPESAGAVNDYPIVALRHGVNPSLAGEFVAYVRSAAGQSVLRTAGFQVPAS